MLCAGHEGERKMRKNKILGLLAVAAISTSVCAGTASASQFEAGEIGKAISATTLEPHIITLTGSKVECTTAKFEGVTEWFGGETQKVHPVYEGCKVFGLSSGVSVSTKGCDYEFNANTTESMGSVKIVDHAGETCNGIVITADPIFTTCTAVVPKQTISSAVGYTNNSGNIAVQVTASEIAVNVTASSGLCPLTTGSHSGEGGGTYTGASEVSAAETTVKWWEENAVPPKFSVYEKPATGGIYEIGETKEIKVEDEGGEGENWTLRSVTIFATTLTWEGSGENNCLDKSVAGGTGFNCIWKVKCKASNGTAIAYILVYWTNAQGRKGESYFGDMRCP